MRTIGWVIGGCIALLALVFLYRPRWFATSPESGAPSPDDAMHEVAARPTESRQDLADLVALDEGATMRRHEVASDAEIRGIVLLPGDTPCREGVVFAWQGDGEPTVAQLRSAGHPGSPLSATIEQDGRFRMLGVVPGVEYTLTAVGPGFLSATRLADVRAGLGPIVLRVSYVYGLAILLEDALGGPVRTAAASFGRWPSASGLEGQMLEAPPELLVRDIEGLQGGRGTRDRWQYLVVAEHEVAELGPAEYRVDVPGYRQAREVVYARPLIRRMEEVVVRLEPLAPLWAEISVRLTVPAYLLEVGLAPDELVGAISLLTEGDPREMEPIEFALHTPALNGKERIGGFPAGSYLARFEAEDSYYETPEQQVFVGNAETVIAFDLADAGTLVLDVRADGALYDGPLVMTLRDSRYLGVFDTKLDGRPYVIPFVNAWEHRVTEMLAPGWMCQWNASAVDLVLEPGVLTVEIARCWSIEGK